MPDTNLRGSSVDVGTDFWAVRQRIESQKQRLVDQPFRDAFGNCCSLALAFGFVQGSIQGFRFRGIQFLAENAHRTPTTKGGWYLYHKTKNYQMMAAGLKRGATRALVFASLPFLVIGTSEVAARLYLNLPYQPWARLLRPRAAKDCPLGVRTFGSAFGGLMLGVLAHRYYRLPVWHRRLIYTRATLAGCALGLMLEGYYWFDENFIEPIREPQEVILVPAQQVPRAALSTNEGGRLV